MAWNIFKRGKVRVTLPTATGTVIATRGADDWVEVAVSNWRPPAIGDQMIVELPLGVRPTITARGIVGENRPSALRALTAYSYAPYKLEVAAIQVANTYVGGTIGFYTDDPMPSGGV